MAYKYTTEFVKDCFNKRGCVFTDPVFLGVMHKHNYICSCGNTSAMTFNNFMKGKNCKNCGFKKIEKTYEEVQEIFSKENAKLTSTEYHGYKQELEFVCACGRNGKRTLVQFNRSKRCQACADESTNYTREEFVEMYASKGFKLLATETKTAHDKHKCICVCGRETEKSWNNLKNGKGCIGCQRERAKFSYDEAFAIYKQYEWTLLDPFYNNNSFLHNARCKCGNITKKRLNELKRSPGCRKCGGNYIPTIEELKLEFASEGCVLKEEAYVNSHVPMQYICKCGNESKINLNNFRNGKRCQRCGDILVYDMSLPSNVYLLRREDQFKIGKNNRKSWRIVTHKNNGWEVIDRIGPITGRDAHEIEKTILDCLDSKGIARGKKIFNEPFDGYTEVWLAKDFYVDSIADLWDRL